MFKRSLNTGSPFRRAGQTIVEYTVLMVIILGVMITMKDYVKRGIQGRWKSAADDFGGQYDPQSVNAMTNYSTQVNSQTQVQQSGGSAVIDGMSESGNWTNRLDTANTLDLKSGFTQVGY